MHEMAITQSVVAAVSEHVGDGRATRVRLEIGRLSGVVADSVRFCFDLAIGGTVLEGALLEIVETPGRAYCRQCQHEVDIEDLVPLCECGSADLKLLGGHELKIKEVEVV
ncbi:MAG: hydrogenase maturation nickel metallochaperone HypA [Egibacteraceae bacterium]